MRLIIVRHGDPNYEIDSLTEKVSCARFICSKILRNL